MSKLRISSHAIERYREHHPQAIREDVQNAVAHGFPVEEPTVRSLLGRDGFESRRWKDCKHRYVLSPDAMGVFVIEDKGTNELIVTYLRLKIAPREFAKTKWLSEEARASIDAGKSERDGSRREPQDTETHTDVSEMSNERTHTPQSPT